MERIYAICTAQYNGGFSFCRGASTWKPLGETMHTLPTTDSYLSGVVSKGHHCSALPYDRVDMEMVVMVHRHLTQAGVTAKKKFTAKSIFSGYIHSLEEPRFS